MCYTCSYSNTRMAYIISIQILSLYQNKHNISNNFQTFSDYSFIHIKIFHITAQLQLVSFSNFLFPQVFWKFYSLSVQKILLPWRLWETFCYPGHKINWLFISLSIQTLTFQPGSPIYNWNIKYILRENSKLEQRQ